MGMGMRIGMCAWSWPCLIAMGDGYGQYTSIIYGHGHVHARACAASCWERRAAGYRVQGACTCLRGELLGAAVGGGLKGLQICRYIGTLPKVRVQGAGCGVRAKEGKGVGCRVWGEGVG